jgi:acyl-CoA reductase-like NAD-dependent aldehyde dehydrogenase
MKRIFIHEKVYDAVRDALVEYAKKVKVGDPLDPLNEIGPVQNRMQFETVLYVLICLFVPESLISRSIHCDVARTFFDDCKKNGYKFALGGEVDQNRKGYFLPLTIIDNPPDISKIVREEREALLSNR